MRSRGKRAAKKQWRAGGGVAAGEPSASVGSREAPPKRTARVAAAALSFLLPLALYSFTFCRDLYWGDSGELALVAHEFGIAHPTGYPLYTLLAGLFVRLVPADPALLANFLSALLGAAATLAAFLLARRLGAGLSAAFFTALLLAVSREVWLQSVVAEVYTLHLLLVTAVFISAVELHSRPATRALAWTSLWLGLALANHLTSFLLLPPVIWLAWSGLRRRGRGVALFAPGAGEGEGTTRRSSGRWIRALSPLLFGLSLYLYLPLRSLADPFLDYGDPEGWGGLRWLVTGSQFHYLMFSSGPSYFREELRLFLPELWRQFAGWPLLLALPGLWGLWRPASRRPLGWATTGYFLLVAGYSFNYRIEDKSAYLLPAYLMAALWIGEGAGWVGRALRGRQKIPSGAGAGKGARRSAAVSAALYSPDRPVMSLAWRATVFFQLLFPLRAHYPLADLHADHSLSLYTRSVLGAAEAEEALVITDDPFVYSAFLYARRVRGEQAGRECLLDYLFPFPWYLEHLRATRPGLVVPEAAREAARRGWESRGAWRGLGFGAAMDRIRVEVKRGLLEANLDRRPVYLHVRDDTTMKEAWGGSYPLEYRGLVYRVRRQPVEPSPYPADYPLFDRRPGDRQRPPDRYQSAAYHKFSDAASRLGVILAAAGKGQEALAAFEKALRFDPGNHVVYRNRGLLRLELLDDLAGARADFLRYREEQERAAGPPDPQMDAIRLFLERTAHRGGEGPP